MLIRKMKSTAVLLDDYANSILVLSIYKKESSPSLRTREPFSGKTGCPPSLAVKSMATIALPQLKKSEK
jgi:hypothetical protein